MGIADICPGTAAAFRAAHLFYGKNGFAEVERSTLPDDFPIMSVDRKFYYVRLS
jgi:hypothetical protein